MKYKFVIITFNIIIFLSNYLIAQSNDGNNAKIDNDSNWNIRESISLSICSGYFWDNVNISSNGMILQYGLEVFLDKEKNWKFNISNIILFESNNKVQDDEEYTNSINIHFKYYLNDKCQEVRYYLIGLVLPAPSLIYFNYGLGCDFKMFNPISFKAEIIKEDWIIFSDNKPMAPLRIQLGFLYNLNF